MVLELDRIAGMIAGAAPADESRECSLDMEKAGYLSVAPTRPSSFTELPVEEFHLLKDLSTCTGAVGQDVDPLWVTAKLQEPLGTSELTESPKCARMATADDVTVAITEEIEEQLARTSSKPEWDPPEPRLLGGLQIPQKQFRVLNPRQIKRIMIRREQKKYQRAKAMAEALLLLDEPLSE